PRRRALAGPARAQRRVRRARGVHAAALKKRPASALAATLSAGARLHRLGKGKKIGAMPLLALLFRLCIVASPVPDAPYRVYVSNEASGDVSVIEGDKEIARIPVGVRPRG